MTQNEIILSLNKIYDESIDSHSIYTPLSLCEEMINSIDSLDGDILVISNLEFLIVLKRLGIDMSNVYYSVGCDIKKQVAVQLGLDINNIYNLDYNKKEVNLGTEENMKFDVIVMNSPYNPNSLWKKFTLKAIDTLKEDGQMVSIHPDNWMYSSRHKKLYDILKNNISVLHIKGFGVFDNAAISTDWYVYNKQKQTECKVFYVDGRTEVIKNNEIKRLLKFPQTSIENSILNKITKYKHHNGIIQAINSWGELYSSHTENGQYKQCGGKTNGTGWIKGNFVLTDKPTDHQFENKVVTAYVRKPRAKYFNDNTGVILGNYWLTDKIDANPESICLLLNSKLFWKIHLALIGNDLSQKRMYSWFLQELFFSGLEATNDKELYEHYNLSHEEIDYIED